MNFTAADPDGTIAGYQGRVVGDTTWSEAVGGTPLRFTPTPPNNLYDNDMVSLPDGTYSIEIRAVDNEGAVDPTPSVWGPFTIDAYVLMRVHFTKIRVDDDSDDLGKGEIAFWLTSAFVINENLLSHTWQRLPSEGEPPWPKICKEQGPHIKVGSGDYLDIDITLDVGLHYALASGSSFRVRCTAKDYDLLHSDDSEWWIQYDECPEDSLGYAKESFNISSDWGVGNHITTSVDTDYTKGQFTVWYTITRID
jgi:hypothetical protein